MPTYEMPLLLKVAGKPYLTSVLKRTANLIFNKGGFIRKIDNLGKLPTPYKISSNNQSFKTFREVNYFIIHFDVPPVTIKTLNTECQLDSDILRCRIYSKNEEEKKECTFHEETLPPVFRPDVQRMLKIGERTKAKEEKNKFKFNTGLDYYPFQR